LSEILWLGVAFWSFTSAMGQVSAVEAMLWMFLVSALFLPFYIILRLLEATLGWRS